MGDIKTKKQPPIVSGDIGTANVTADGPPSQQKGPILGPGDAGFVSPEAYAKLIAAYNGAGHPVDRFSGAVIEDAVDLRLPGIVPLELQRVYNSHHAPRKTELGVGGWSFALSQWIEEDAEGFRLVDADGRFVQFDRINPGEATFRRAKRYDIRRPSPSSFSVYHLDTLLERIFTADTDADGTWSRAMLREIRDRCGNKISLEYAADGLSRVVDTANRDLRFLYDDGLVVRVEVHVDGTCRQRVDYHYHATGELSTVVDALGYATSFEYDGKHRMTRTTLKNGVSFYYQFDPELGQCIKTWGDGGIYTFEFVRRSEDDKLIVTTVGNGEPKVSTFDSRGNLVRHANLAGTYVELAERDPDSYLLSSSNAAGEVTTRRYDERGNLVSLVDAAGNETKWEYVEDQPVRVTRPGGLVVEYRHDAFGKRTSIRFPTGSFANYEYDRYGRLVSIGGVEGLAVRFEFDNRHNLVAESDESGATWHYTYDPLGRPLSRTDPLGHTTRMEYDALGRVTRTIYSDGTRSEREYDGLGALSRFVNCAGEVTELVHIGTGRLAKQVLPDGQTWHFQYDKLERLVRVTNPAHEVYDLAYDATGNLVEERTFDGRRFQYAYDRAGRMGTVRMPDNQWRRFEYDGLGNILVEDSPHGTRTYERDSLGRLVKATVDEGQVVVVEFERDEFGSITKELQGVHQVTVAYDNVGRRVRRDAPAAGVTHYSYAAGVLRKVVQETSAGKLEIGLRFDALKREVGRRSTDGRVDIARSYDARSCLVEQVVKQPLHDDQPGEPGNSRRIWRHDAVGRVRELEDKRWGTTRYEYDPQGRLVGVGGPHRNERFDYHGNGGLNRVLDVSKPDNVAGSGFFDLAPGNVLRRTDRYSYEYDACNRRTAMVDRRTSERTEYTWDCRSQLREIRFPDGRRARYFYDALGRRMRKEEYAPMREAWSLEAPTAGDETGLLSRSPAKVTEFIWDGNQLVGELGGDVGTRGHVHYPGTFVPLLQVQDDKVFVVITDQVGAATELVDRSGQVCWSASYGAWGNLVDEYSSSRSLVRSPFRLLGHYFDAESGLSASRFRFWDATTARWCSADPMGIWGGSNLFAFDGAPSVVTDPYGLCLLAGVLDKDGNEKFAKWYYSGEMDKKGLDPNDPQDRLRSHTEREFLDDAEAAGLAPGDTMVMWGRLDPCAPGCRPAIRQAVDEHGVDATYAATETGTQWTWQPTSQDRPRAQVVQTEERSDGTVDTRRYWQRNGSGDWTSRPYDPE